MSIEYPRPVTDPDALEASAGLMGVVSMIGLAASLGPMAAGLEGISGGADVAAGDLGIAEGGGVTLPEGIELG